tara:strand:+ start:475 stop:702 length:228 start_codon:yes stop_codon:yes gene_type:complete
MKLLKNYYILLILLSISFFVQFIFNKYNQFKKEKELNNQSDRIENCIDIENKSKRSVYENIKLSEYCIDNFVTTK